MSTATLYCKDCFEVLPKLEDKSVDIIFCDLPYGRTQNKWECMLDLDLLWEQYNRIIKDDGVIALWAQAPYAKKMPMKAHENILIFYKKLSTYNPQMTTGYSPVHSYTKHTTDGSCYGKTETGISGGGSTMRYPRDILSFSWDTQKSSIHPTQKPLEACNYMIRTYTNEGDVVLDNCMGSGSVGVACALLNRNFIGIEIIEDYYELASERINRTLGCNLYN